MRKFLFPIFLLLVVAAEAQTEQKDSTINEVRVGYTSGDRNMVAGAVEQLTEDRLNKGLVTSSLEALSGQAAGVQVSSAGNHEAMVSAVRVRGTTSLTGGNDPLVIVDGVTSDLGALSAIFPSDIESFTILKDASETAQYGSRGAAGVIEVATKRGKSQPFHISYDATIGFESIYKRMEMLNAEQFRQINADFKLPYIDKGYDTDFSKSIERTGFVHKHHVAFGGGNETAFYRASIGYMEHKTVIKNSGNQSIIAKLDISQKAFDNYLTVDLGMFGSLQKNDVIPFTQKLLYSAATFNPTFPEGANSDGTYNQVTEATWISNPYSLLEMKQKNNNVHINIHVSATLNLLKDLKLKVFGSYTYSNINNSHYYPTFVWSHGEAYRGSSKQEEGFLNLSLNYALKQGNSSLNLMTLAELQKEKRAGFWTTVTNFSTNAFGFEKLSAGAARPWSGTDSYYTSSNMESFLFRAQYSYAGKYTLTANARGDVSSKFGKNHRWGFFPSISGAWVLSKERWMSSLSFITNAKLRIGYGLSGSQGGIDSYNSLQLVQPNGIVSVEGAPTTTIGIVRNANPDLKWEVKRTFNVGLDLSFWNDRIAMAIDYYHSKTTDMLYVYDVPVPPFTYNKLLANLGSMENSGLEIGFSITPLHTRNMELTVNMNWAFPRNKLLSLNGYYNGQYLTTPQESSISSLWGAGFHGASGVVKQIVGEPLGVFKLPHCKRLVNFNGQNFYNVTEENYICGQATPKATMGSNIAFRYSQWDITVQINGAFGHKIYNGTALSYMNLLSLPSYNVMQGARELNITDQTISDYWLENGDYVNFDYLTVGWSLPIKSKYIQGIRISASVNNLATITGYSGLSPMINSSIINGTLGIDDKNVIPPYRSYTMGVSIKF